MAETRKAFHEELDDLNQDVVRLAALATEAIQRGTNALLDSDLASVERIIEHDKELDVLTHSIEHRTYQLLARQQPMAVDLRVLVTILRGIHEIERVGDLMINVVKTTRRLYPQQLDPKVRGILHRMREQAVAQLSTAVDAFAERDPSRAAALEDMDDVMDDLQKELFRTIFAAQSNDEAALQLAVQIALVGRYYERIADHAVNFGQRVRFMVTGEDDGGPGDD
jgi:phosphate transport system protein